MLRSLFFCFFFCLSAAGQNREVLVAAASDLAGVDQAIAQAFQQQTGITVRFTLNSSGLLAKQIMSGAPYDVFLSANEKFVRDLIANRKANVQTTQVFGVGRLALWSKNRKLTGWSDLSKPEIQKVAVANPELAPYGRAAVQAMVRNQLWTTVQKKVVYGESVRQALQYAESGNVDVAVVAWTLVYNKGGLLVPEEDYVPLRQTATLVSGAPHQAEAYKFLQFLTSEKCQQILVQHGLMKNTGRGF